MKTLSSVLAIVFFGGAVAAQEAASPPPAGGDRNEAAIEILKKVDRAAKSVSSVRYSATSTPSGLATNFAAAAEGETTAEGWANGIPVRFLTHVRARRPGSDEPVELTGGADGEIYYLIDHGAKKAWSDIDPGVMGQTGRAIRGFGMPEFLHDHPFDDELGAETIELLEDREIAGEPCHQLRVVYSGGQGESLWFVSKSDFLPRRRVLKFSQPGQGEGTIEVTVTKLEVNPQLEPRSFVFAPPEGFEVIDDFAP